MMEFTIRNLQTILGLAVLVILLSWCLWRLAGWVGLICIKPSKPMAHGNEAKPMGGKFQKKPSVSISKQALYSRKRIR